RIVSYHIVQFSKAMPSRDDLYILPDSSGLVKHFFEVLFKRTGIRPAAASCHNSLFSISSFRPVVKRFFSTKMCVSEKHLANAASGRLI
ncbi:hypothetical protein, partial [Megasphaera stantonii]|uniref:hypothetical protein n=1 Tax=Megasphaera stantonii TaxID=2144175 RepID=UPI0023F27D26